MPVLLSFRRCYLAEERTITISFHTDIAAFVLLSKDPTGGCSGGKAFLTTLVTIFRSEQKEHK